jgi:hypothetical protein
MLVREGKYIQKNLKKRDHLENLGVYGRVNIKMVFQ